MITHIHGNGQKAGIYWRPGLAAEVLQSNPLISGSGHRVSDILTLPYAPGNAYAASDPATALSNYKIDFSKAAAQSYVESIVNLFVIGPLKQAKNLTMGLVSRRGTLDNRVWTLELANLGDEALKGAQLNMFTLVQSSGQGSCQPTVSTGFPIVVGDIPARSFKTLEVSVDFSQCATDAQFNASASYSSDLGAVAASSVALSLEQ